MRLGNLANVFCAFSRLVIENAHTVLQKFAASREANCIDSLK